MCPPRTSTIPRSVETFANGDIRESSGRASSFNDYTIFVFGSVKNRPSKSFHWMVDSTQHLELHAGLIELKPEKNLFERFVFAGVALTLNLIKSWQDTKLHYLASHPTRRSVPSRRDATYSADDSEGRRP